MHRNRIHSRGMVMTYSELQQRLDEQDDVESCHAENQHCAALRARYDAELVQAVHLYQSGIVAFHVALQRSGAPIISFYV